MPADFQSTLRHNFKTKKKKEQQVVLQLRQVSDISIICNYHLKKLQSFFFGGGGVQRSISYIIHYFYPTWKIILRKAQHQHPEQKHMTPLMKVVKGHRFYLTTHPNAAPSSCKKGPRPCCCNQHFKKCWMISHLDEVSCPGATHPFGNPRWLPRVPS